MHSRSIQNTLFLDKAWFWLEAAAKTSRLQNNFNFVVCYGHRINILLWSDTQTGIYFSYEDQNRYVFTIIDTTLIFGAWDSVMVLVGRTRDRSPLVLLGIFFRGSFRQNHVPWGRISIWKWLPGISPGVKATGAFDWRPTTLVVPKIVMIQGLNLPGTPRATLACRGIPLLYLRSSLYSCYRAS